MPRVAGIIELERTGSSYEYTDYVTVHIPSQTAQIPGQIQIDGHPSAGELALVALMLHPSPDDKRATDHLTTLDDSDPQFLRGQLEERRHQKNVDEPLGRASLVQKIRNPLYAWVISDPSPSVAVNMLARVHESGQAPEALADITKALGHVACVAESDTASDTFRRRHGYVERMGEVLGRFMTLQEEHGKPQSQMSLNRYLERLESIVAKMDSGSGTSSGAEGENGDDLIRAVLEEAAEQHEDTPEKRAAQRALGFLDGDVRQVGANYIIDIHTAATPELLAITKLRGQVGEAAVVAAASAMAAAGGSPWKGREDAPTGFITWAGGGLPR